MVLTGHRGKNKSKPIKEALARASSKMAAKALAAQHAASPAGSDRADSEEDEDTHLAYSGSPTPSQPGMSQPDFLKHMEKMLNKALKVTSDQITNRLSREIRELGQRTADLETRVDDIELTLQEHAQEQAALREENMTLLSRLEDAENCSRRSNLRLRGIPEVVEDIQSFATALFQELCPSIPIECLEFDRIHRALTRRQQDGPPRDIIIKLHFFRTKEQLLTAARNKDALQFQNHNYQLFSDLAPLTIAKRRAMKPQLQILIQHQIKYTWRFPFSLQFTYQGQQHSSTTPESLQRLLETLHLSPPQHQSETALPRTPARSSYHPYTTTPKQNQQGPSSIRKGTPSRQANLFDPKSHTSR